MIGIVIVLIVLTVIIAVIIILGVLEIGGGGTQNKGGMIFKRGGVLTPLLMW